MPLGTSVTGEKSHESPRSLHEQQVMARPLGRPAREEHMRLRMGAVRSSCPLPPMRVRVASKPVPARDSLQSELERDLKAWKAARAVIARARKRRH